MSMMPVALRKESVDRNGGLVSVVRFASASLSARRAWIEMVVLCLSCVLLPVALRKESVDRNSRMVAVLPAKLVALRKESVDRNRLLYHCFYAFPGRSPQGERG